MKNKTPKKHKKELNKALSKLERIQELGNENFVLLTPTGSKHEDCYLNYLRVPDYLYLFDTLKSMLNVCILALDEQVDETLIINNRESDVKAVLEFAKNLIPMEEGNYLDKMRELMPSNKKNK